MKTDPTISTISDEILFARLTGLLPGEVPLLAASLNAKRLDYFSTDFYPFAHEHQKPPAFAGNGEPWTTWLLLGGRGAGKTLAGAAWVRRHAELNGSARIALVGETERDVREVMIEGVSGLLTIHPFHERPVWVPSRRRLVWKNGAVAEAFSAEDPDSLRGPQFSAAWCDELAKWRHAEATFDMLQFGLRLGVRPRQVNHHHAAADCLAQAADRGSCDGADACRHHRERFQFGARVSRLGREALPGHAARPPGARRRTDRGPPRRAVVARAH